MWKRGLGEDGEGRKEASNSRGGGDKGRWKGAPGQALRGEVATGTSAGGDESWRNASMIYRGPGFLAVV